MANEEGLVVVSITRNKSMKMIVRAVDGRTAVITAPWTPSCHHANANQRALFRRFSRPTAELIKLFC